MRRGDSNGMSRDSSIRCSDDDMTNGQKYQAIVQECPELASLVEELELIDPETGRRFGVSEQEERTRMRLSSIAQETLSQGRIYTTGQVISLLAEKLTITRERAVRGLEMMLSSGVLTTSTGSGIRLAL